MAGGMVVVIGGMYGMVVGEGVHGCSGMVFVMATTWVVVTKRAGAMVERVVPHHPLAQS